jgi:hypothetical protein
MSKEATELFGKRFMIRLSPLIIVVFLVAACGEESSSDTATENTQQSAATTVESNSASGETTAAMAETTAEENAYNPNAEIGPKEESNMLPADGKKPDEPQPLPENPPEGVKTYPATTNKLVEGEIQYDRDPPTNGKHSPIWQNCGFYSEPVDNSPAVHSMDHGVVWITYRPDLPADQIEQLRPYGDEKYVIVSPYPDLPAPVVATAWRNQIYLEGANDPRLREFVDEFRISEISPLSGNRCVGGVGEPDA